MIFETGNGIIQTGNGIIYPTSWPLIRKLLLQNVSHFYQGVRIQFFKQEMEIFKQDMDLFLHFQVSDKKKLLLLNVSYVHQGVRIRFSKQEIESFLCLPCPVNTSFSKCFSFTLRSPNQFIKQEIELSQQ